MRWFRFAILLILFAVVQAGLANLKYKPDLLLVLLVLFSIYSGRKDAIITSFSIGLASDLIGFAVGFTIDVGPAIISFGIIGTLLNNLNRLFTIHRMHYQGLTIFIIGFLTALAVYHLNLIKGHLPSPDAYRIMFWTSALSAIVGPFLFLPAAWWMRINITGRKS